MREFSYVINKPQGGLSVDKDAGGARTIDGHVKTPLGMVSVYSYVSAAGLETLKHKKGWTSLRFIHNRRVYCRSIDRYYTPRGLVTIAARFAKEIASC